MYFANRAPIFSQHVALFFLLCMYHATVCPIPQHLPMHVAQIDSILGLQYVAMYGTIHCRRFYCSITLYLNQALWLHACMLVVITVKIMRSGG